MKRILFCVCFWVLFLACESNDDESSNQSSNFYALKVGNSWVYKHYKYSPSLDEYLETSVVDSVSIVGKEQVYGNTYYKVRTWTTGNDSGSALYNANGEHFEFFRDYEGTLLRDDGFVKFTNNDYSKRLIWEEDWGSVYERLVEGTTELTVEAGTFTCINSEMYLITASGEQLPGLDRFYYAEGIGLVLSTVSFVSQSVPSVYRRLDSYEINN